MAHGTKTALIYARVSTTDQSPEMQIQALRDYIQQRGWSNGGEYVDLCSGAKDRRPELDRLTKDIHLPTGTVVVCWRFDRFARSVRHLVMALEEFRARGIDFVSMHDGIDTSTPSGRFTFHVIAAVAELERELIRARSAAGVAAARRRGVRLGRPPVEFSVDRALEMRRQGKSYRAIARALKVGTTTVYKKLRDVERGVLQVPPAAEEPTDDESASTTVVRLTG